jgi:hypothetical protein
MKRDFKAFLTASVLALSLVIAPTVSVMAAGDNDTADAGGSQTIEGYADPGTPTTVVDDSGNMIKNFSSSSIDVQSSILGSSEKIIYSISIGYGDMKFAYDFGQTWDPVNHRYLDNGSNSTEGGWVVYNHVDGSNNAITVKNDSNYPVSVTLSFDLNQGTNAGSMFNSDYNANNAVIGIFSDSNNTLSQNVNTATYNGYGATATSGLTTTSFNLDMDYSNLGNDDVDYGVLGTGIYSKTVYFTLCGTPDSTSSLSAEYESVGTIKIVIKPVDKNSTTTRPKKS